MPIQMLLLMLYTAIAASIKNPKSKAKLADVLDEAIAKLTEFRALLPAKRKRAARLRG